MCLLVVVLGGQEEHGEIGAQDVTERTVFDAMMLLELSYR